MCTFTADMQTIPGDTSGVNAWALGSLHYNVLRGAGNFDLEIILRKAAIIYKPLWGIFVPFLRSEINDTLNELLDTHFNMFDRCYNERSINYMNDPLRSSAVYIGGILTHNIGATLLPARGLRAIGTMLRTLTPASRLTVCTEPRCRLFYPSNAGRCPWCAAVVEPPKVIEPMEQPVRNTRARQDRSRRNPETQSGPLGMSMEEFRQRRRNAEANEPPRPDPSRSWMNTVSANTSAWSINPTADLNFTPTFDDDEED